jgi:cupin superfamily acireductone dioxygenase involved in methionine salvage
MKKFLFCALVLCVTGAAFVFADRNAIDETVSAYEAVIVEAENLAAMPLIAVNDFTAIQQKAEAVGPKIAAIENEREWAIQDAIKLAELNARFNKAMTAIAKIVVKY